MKPEIKNGQLVISLDASKIKSKSQLFTLNTLVKDGQVRNAIDYVQTFTGKRNRNMSIPKIKSFGEDRLEFKDKESVYKTFRKLFNYGKTHTPQGTAFNDYIGVEIECFIPRSEVDAYLGMSPAKRGGTVECSHCDGVGYINHDCGDDSCGSDDDECGDCYGRGSIDLDDDDIDESDSRYMRLLGDIFFQNRIKTVAIKSDGSIRAADGCFPVELAILTRLGDPKTLEQVCSLLNKLKAKVNKSCGMHIHLDARHLNNGSFTRVELGRVTRNFTNAMPVLAGMVPKSRRENEYCKLGVSKVDSGGRYYAVNLQSFNKYRTVEVRLHSSTTDFKKIIQWSQLVKSIMDSAGIPKVCPDVNTLSECIPMSEETMEYIGQRTALFNGESVALGIADLDDSDRVA